MIFLIAFGVGCGLFPSAVKWTSRHPDSPVTIRGSIAGLVIMFGLVVAILRYEKTEKGSRLLNKGKARRLERSLNHLHFIRRHSWVVLAFILFALAVLGHMALLPAGAKAKPEVIGLHTIGIVFGFAYLVALALFLYARITKKWDMCLDAAIRYTEDRLAQAKSLAGLPPA
jgi:uncharacterized membrane protein